MQPATTPQPPHTRSSIQVKGPMRTWYARLYPRVGGKPQKRPNTDVATKPRAGSPKPGHHVACLPVVAATGPD